MILVYKNITGQKNKYLKMYTMLCYTTVMLKLLLLFLLVSSSCSQEHREEQYSWNICSVNSTDKNITTWEATNLAPSIVGKQLTFVGDIIDMEDWGVRSGPVLFLRNSNNNVGNMEMIYGNLPAKISDLSLRKKEHIKISGVGVRGCFTTYDDYYSLEMDVFSLERIPRDQ